MDKKPTYEEDLRKYRDIVSSTPDGISFLDKEYRYVIVNDAYEQFSGVKREHFLGMTVSEYLGKDNYELYVKPELDRCMKGETINYQEWFHYPTLGRRFVDVTYFPYKDVHGTIMGVIANTRDITERKEANERLDYLANLLNAVEQAVIATDKEGNITYWNPFAEKLYGWTALETAGKTITELIAAEESNRLNLEIIAALQKGQVWSGEYTAKNRDGTVFPVHTSCTPVMNECGEIESIIGVSFDITEKKQWEKQLLQAQKMESIGTLAGGIAHDFNNLLSVLMGNVSIALSLLSKDNELFDVLSEVLQGTKQAQTLTRQLLTFAKGGKPIKKVCNINTIVEESARFVTSGTRSKCNFALAEDLWTAEVDSGQINQVISNMVINADQAMPNGGVITVQSENIRITGSSELRLVPGLYVRIAIKDHGIGIQETYIPNIFDPYFTTKQKGSGLGLATAYSIVKGHGGLITVYSEVGKGAVFSVYLPAAARQTAETDVQRHPKHRGHGRILVMDDQEPILTMVGRMLTLMGYEVETVTDGAEAIRRYREAYEANNPYTLVILDLTVPGGMGGAAAIPELLAIDPEVKAVVSSGYSNDPVMANYQDYGFCGVVPKPYTKAQLAELLNRIAGEEYGLHNFNKR
ncbi:MAG: PAS domain S-box protein [Spirochaetia bacterium]|nr:PAS domain S-box protein [Spirochaetia bacterium]